MPILIPSNTKIGGLGPQFEQVKDSILLILRMSSRKITQAVWKALQEMTSEMTIPYFIRHFDW